MSLLSRFIGIITAPRATFESIVAHPKWFGMLALTILVLMAVLIGGFLVTKVGQEAWLDAATNSRLSGPVTDQQYQAMEKMSSFVGYITAVSIIIDGAALPGGHVRHPLRGLQRCAGRRRQLQAGLHRRGARRGPIGLLGQLFTVPLNYLRGTMSSSTNLGVLTQSMLDDGSFIARLLGMIDLFLIWWVLVLATGLAVLYRRRTQPMATSLFVLYAVIAVIVAFVRRGAGA